MNDEILRLYRQLRKERCPPGDALRAARSTYQNTVVANMLGIPSAKEIANEFYAPKGYISVRGHAVSFTTAQTDWREEEDDVGGTFSESSSARERREQEVFSIDTGRFQDRFLYFRPSYSEATYRADCERAKTGKAEAIRRASEYRQQLVDDARDYRVDGSSEHEVAVEFCGNEPEYFFIYGRRDDDLRVAEEIRTMLCFALP